MPEINEPAWVILSGFSVESDLFMIDIDTNSGNFGHTVLWELALFDSDFVPTYEPDIQMNFDSENDVIVEVNLTGMNPEIAYRFDLHVHYPGIPYSSNNFGRVDIITRKTSRLASMRNNLSLPSIEAILSRMLCSVSMRTYSMFQIKPI